MDALRQSLVALGQKSLVIAPCFIAIILLVGRQVYLTLTASHIPRSIPWVTDGIVKGRFGRTRALLLEPFASRRWVEDGYRRFGAMGRPFVLPMFSMLHMVVLPPEQLNWLMTQPDTILGSWQPLITMMGMQYTLTGVSKDDFFKLPYHVNNYHAHTINQKLTRNLPRLVASIAAELDTALEKRWGSDTESWQEVSCETITDVIIQVISATFISDPLSRSEEYIQTTKRYTRLAGELGILGSILIPQTLAPLLMPMLTYPAKRAGLKYDALILPLVKDRLASTKARREQPEDQHSDPPFDMLQWIVDDALDTGNPANQTADAVASRMGLLNFVSNHTTAINAISAIMNLSVGPEADHNWMMIREEVQAALSQGDGSWSKDNIRDLAVVNSAVRESLRFSNTRAAANEKLILPTQGVTLPSGEHLVQGTIVGTALAGGYGDERIYSEPDKFKPLRFLDQAEEETVDSTGSAENSKASKNQPFTMPSKDFMPFGFGRHACPGRFFAGHEIKLLIATIALRYDIEPLKEKPPPFVLSINTFPNAKANLRVRRRR